MTTATDPPAADPVEDQPATTAPAGANRPRPGGVRASDPPEAATSRGSTILPWALAAVGLLGTLGFAAAWQAERGDGPSPAAASAGVARGDSSELLEAARSFSDALTNFDGATIDRDFDLLTTQATGEFRSQLDRFFSTDIRTQLKEAQAASRGEIRSAFVQTAEDDRGTVFVVVDQTIANNRSPLPQADTLRMELGMIRDEGEWLVERVSVLTAPAGGAALTPGD